MHNTAIALTTSLIIALIAQNSMGALPIAPGAELMRVSDAFAFTEGPAADRQGNVFFTDQPNDSIHFWDASTGEFSLFLHPSGRSNGMYFSVDGRLISCADAEGELWSIDVATKEVSVLLSDYEGKLFNGPNDAWVDAEGGIYFTDPFYKRSYWANRDEPDQVFEGVFYLAPGASEPVVFDKTLVKPNGIIGSPDGRLLYVADIGDNKTYVYSLTGDGGYSERKLFCELGSDGMTLDEKGNVYLTGRGVTVFDKEGNELGNISVPEGWTANVTFAGEDFRTLFITAMGSIYTIDMAVAGYRYSLTDRF